MIFVNFKAYEEGSGQKAVNLTKILEEVSLEKGVKIIPAVQIIDAELIVDSTKLEVWIQHLDPVSYGAHTGWTLPEEAVRVGVKGVFLNHSEHKFEDGDALKKACERAREVDLKTVIFAQDLEELTRVLSLRPAFVAYEPPELIGEKEISVASEKGEVIKKASELAKKEGIPLIVGAGIHAKEDVRKSLEFGAVGVAVATDVVKAENPKLELADLADGFLERP